MNTTVVCLAIMAFMVSIFLARLGDILKEEKRRKKQEREWEEWRKKPREPYQTYMD